jgi:hypothetical protein
MGFNGVVILIDDYYFYFYFYLLKKKKENLSEVKQTNKQQIKQKTICPFLRYYTPSNRIDIELNRMPSLA